MFYFVKKSFYTDSTYILSKISVDYFDNESFSSCVKSQEKIFSLFIIKDELYSMQKSGLCHIKF